MRGGVEQGRRPKTAGVQRQPEGTGRIYEWPWEGTSSDRDSFACEGTRNPNGCPPAADAPPPITGVRGCAAGSPTSTDLPVREEGLRTGCDRDAFGSGYRALEVEITFKAPRIGRADVHTPHIRLIPSHVSDVRSPSYHDLPTPAPFNKSGTAGVARRVGREGTIADSAARDTLQSMLDEDPPKPSGVLLGEKMARRPRGRRGRLSPLHAGGGEPATG